MSACKRCGAESQSMIGGFCLDCFPSFQTIGVSTKEDASMADIADLKADRDELHATLSGLCSFLGAGTPDATTPAVELNRLIHDGIRKREEAAREKAGKERDELKQLIADFVEQFPIPELDCRCHIRPPCSDCVEYGAQRETIAYARKLLEAKS